MGCQNKGMGYHYGLDFALSHSAEEIQDVVKRLAKRNRGQKKAIITSSDKPTLRRQLKERMKVRRQKEDQRYTRRFK